MNLASTLSSLVDLLPTSPIANLTTRKYALPDKAVASQVLMYRQLLHTACKPGLRLSRGYEGTDAQRAVKHMPVSDIIHPYCSMTRSVQSKVYFYT
jgi:hypothetical protein